ncbi:MAG: hypothetical protein ACXWXR_04255 [Candidatus Limnocylindrales bacterium]
MATVFLLLALLKPWSFLENGAAGQSPGRSSIPTGPAPAIGVMPSEATPSPIPDPNAMDCLSDRTEQVVILERWPEDEVRSWIAAPEVAARGPLDDHLGVIQIFSSHVVGLGICSSGTESRQGSTARLLDVRSIIESSDGPVSVSLGVPDPITQGVGGADAAVLYGAPRAILPSPSVGRAPVDERMDETGTPSAPGNPASATWPTGSYAVAFSFPSDGVGVVRWLRIDLIHGAGSAG